MSGDGSNVVDWYPTRLLQKRSAALVNGPALIILNQRLNDISALERIWENTSLHVAADGGANRLYETRSRSTGEWADKLDVIIGDLDSLRDEVRDYYTSLAQPAVLVHDPDQYSTDFAKAVKYVRLTHPSTRPVDIIAMGGLGGRVDQGLSQLHHLYLFQPDAHYAEGRLYLVSGEGLTFLLKAGRHRIRVREEGSPDHQGHEDLFDKYVGILPVGAPSMISTRGLEWDVTDWRTEFGGQISTSNHILPETEVVEVHTTSDVLFTVALRPTGAERG